MPNNRNRNPFKKGVTKKSNRGTGYFKKKSSIYRQKFITDYFPVIVKLSSSDHREKPGTGGIWDLDWDLDKLFEDEQNSFNKSQKKE